MKLLRLAALCLFGVAAAAQVPFPQIQLTGNVGPGGVFPLFNSGTVSFTSDADHAMVYPEMSAYFLRVTSTVSLTATRNLIAPLTQGFTFAIKNSTTGGQSIQVIGSTGSGVTIPNGAMLFVSCDGANYVTGFTAAGLTSFAAPGTSWPSWLHPSVASPTSTPQLGVSADPIPNAALEHNSTTVNGQPCVLGSSCTISAALGSHIVTTGPTPTITAGAGAGGGTVTITGNDTAGMIHIHTGGSTTAGALFTVTFASSYGSAPFVVTQAAGNGLFGSLFGFIDDSATDWTYSVSNPCTTFSDFFLYYQVMGTS